MTSDQIGKALCSHLPWIVTMIFAAGMMISTVKSQSDRITSIEQSMTSINVKVENLGQSSVRMESIRSDIAEIKDDVKEIRAVLFKPTNGSTAKTSACFASR